LTDEILGNMSKNVQSPNAAISQNLHFHTLQL
jgi:hypothetical protein